MNERQLKQLHSVEMSILDEIVRVCEHNNLRYYLIAGTLLGSIRHQGFIPWDDDLDIAMPREDYEKFCKIASSSLSSDYYIHSNATDSSYWLPFIKVRKRNTVFDESILSDTQNRFNGIWVDIFPLDYANSEYSKWRNFRIWLYNNIQFFIVNKLHHRRPDSLKGRFFYAFLGWLSIEQLSGAQNILMKWENGGSRKFMINYGSKYSKLKWTVPRSWYEPAIPVVFEGKEYLAPHHSQGLLSRIYGEDYMDLPPVEKRVTHDPVRLSFDTSGPDEELGNNKKYSIGYTTGVFDLFHIGHLNVLRRAKDMCEYLIVGVSTDEVVESYKRKRPTIPYLERAAIVSSIRYVDKVVPQKSMDKMVAWEELHFDVLFHGDDWKGSNMYDDIQRKLKEVGCDMVFLPHTEGISSSALKERLSAGK